MAVANVISEGLSIFLHLEGSGPSRANVRVSGDAASGSLWYSREDSDPSSPFSTEGASGFSSEGRREVSLFGSLSSAAEVFLLSNGSPNSGDFTLSRSFLVLFLCPSRAVSGTGRLQVSTPRVLGLL